MATCVAFTYLFIAHDLSMVEHISNRVAVMYVGRIGEVADTEALFAAPRHPYSAVLLAAVPVADPRLRQAGGRTRLAGEVADPARPPAGCAFHPRCSHATPVCAAEVPSLRNVGAGHLAACHRAERLSLRGVAGS